MCIRDRFGFDSSEATREDPTRGAPGGTPRAAGPLTAPQMASNAARRAPPSHSHRLGSDESALRERLKRKYAASILALEGEFLKRRKKGKLPAGATSALKAWWRERLEWPYPTDEDKKALGEETGLDATQINNWFINQRKRHWHKLFARGEQAPATPEEARAALARNHGSLEKALEAARRA